MKLAPDDFSQQKTSPLRAVYANSKEVLPVPVIMNPDAMEFYAMEVPAMDDADFAEAIEEAQEIIDGVLADGRTFSETEERRLAQLFASGIDCEDLGLTYQD